MAVVVTPGECAVIYRRMEALKRAINQRNLIDIQFSYDQVLRALTKAFDTEKNK
jgi:hypothetical protein